MNCKGSGEIIGEYLDGELDGRRTELMESHLRDCNRCRSEVKELRSALAWLKQAEDAAPPPDLRSRVLARLKQEKSVPARRFVPRVPKVVAAAAVFVMLVAGNLALALPPAVSEEGVFAVRERSMESAPAPKAPLAEERVGVALAPEITDSSETDKTAEPPEATAGDYRYSMVALEDPAPRRVNAIYLFVYNLVLLPLFALLAVQAARERRLT